MCVQINREASFLVYSVTFIMENMCVQKKRQAAFVMRKMYIQSKREAFSLLINNKNYTPKMFLLRIL